MMETLHVEQLAAPSVSSFEALPALADLFSTTQTLQNASRAGKATKSGMTVGHGGPIYVCISPSPSMWHTMWILFRLSKDEINGAMGMSNLLQTLDPL